MARILKNIYVVNVLLAANSEEGAMAAYHSSRQLLREAKMNLRDYLSNAPNVNSAIEWPDRHSRSKIKVLGLHWSTSSDMITVSTHAFRDPQITKRSTLRFIHQQVRPFWI